MKSIFIELVEPLELAEKDGKSSSPLLCTPPVSLTPIHSALTLVGESDRKLVKLAMKHAPPESIKQRVIPPEVIAEVTKELEDLEGEVKAVQREEKEEKEVISSCFLPS